MDALTLRASLVSQRDAAFWHAQARRHQDLAAGELRSLRPKRGADAAACQRIAADLALADRTFRGLEG